VISVKCGDSVEKQFIRIMSLEDIIKKVVGKGLINDDQPSMDIFNLDYFRGRISSLRDAFPEPFFNHAMAVKANTIRGIMMEANKQGLGAECASLQEAKHAVSLGFEPSKVVFDSPVKTSKDIKEAIELGLHMNLDNEQEISRVSSILSDRSSSLPIPCIGLRINPVVGAGQIDMMSTASKASKFGLAVMAETQDKVVDIFSKNSWLTGVHIHVGSQGIPIDKFVSGVRVMMDFIEVLEKEVPGQIKTLDIGGGLSTSYTQQEEPKEFTYQRYRDLLNKEAPSLFTGRYKVVTEFGRSLFLKAGTSLTRVEYVKDWVEGQRPILLTHLGTNQFTRSVYLPHVWRHRFSLFDSQGNIKTGPDVCLDIAGPLCFQGDYLAKEVNLPSAQADDILAIHDTGAYTMSMYTKFNSILASPVYGVSGQNNGLTMVCYKKRETVEECLQFWGLEQPEHVDI